MFCCKFGPYGDILASAGFDRQIFLWNVFGECENIACLPGQMEILFYVSCKERDVLTIQIMFKTPQNEMSFKKGQSYQILGISSM